MTVGGWMMDVDCSIERYHNTPTRSYDHCMLHSGHQHSSNFPSQTILNRDKIVLDANCTIFVEIKVTYAQRVKLVTFNILFVICVCVPLYFSTVECSYLVFGEYHFQLTEYQNQTNIISGCWRQDWPLVSV